jgi:hypothetical protein
MSLEEIYDRYIGLWPMHIGISDGTPAAGDGYLFPELDRVHDEAEGRIEHPTDHWGSLFTWSMFQATHKYARMAASRGEVQIDIRSVPFELIDEYVRKNLTQPEWQPERSRYVGFVSEPSEP